MMALPDMAPPFPVLCFGYHPWSSMWKRNQSLMTALARRPAIERVVFVNPEVSIVSPLRQIAFELRSLRRHSWRGVIPYRPVPGVEVRTPIHLVPFRSRFAMCARLDRAWVRTTLDRFGGRPFLLLINGVRAEGFETIELVEGQAAFQVFDWSDDFAQFPRDPRARETIERLTEERVRRADLVLAVNEKLAARARDWGARVEVVPNATGLKPADIGASALVPGAHALERRVRHPVVGYCGFINEHRLDIELVNALARRHPEWTILFLGVMQLDIARRLPALPNLIVHPPVPHSELAQYLKIFDVCIIPHLVNAHTAGNDPLKIYDYLTTGRPIVSTPVAGVAPFGDVIRVAGNVAEFIAAVESAVAEGMGDKNGKAARARQLRAQAHTWEARAAQVEAAVLEALGGARERAFKRR